MYTIFLKSKIKYQTSEGVRYSDSSESSDLNKPKTKYPKAQAGNYYGG